MWPTSQEGGNLIHDNGPAMTAPGTEPATPMPSAEHMSDPDVGDSARIPLGTAAARRPHTGFAPSQVSWKVITDG